MVAGGIGDLGGLAGGKGVIAPHHALKLGKLAHHRRAQVELGDACRALGRGRVGPDHRRDPRRERRDPPHPVGLRAEQVVECHRPEPLGPLRHPGLCDAQVLFPEEAGIRQPRRQHAGVAGKDRRAAVLGLDIGDGDEMGDPPRCVAGREELLMLAHRGLEHLGRQVEEFGRDRPHEDDGPFDEPRHLGQKCGIGHDRKAAGKGHRLGVRRDLARAPVVVEHDLRGRELAGVILEPRHAKARGRHEAVPRGRVARGDALDRDRHDLGARGPREDAQDRVQRAHPAQRPRPPAHRLGPGKAAHDLGQHLGDDLGGGAPRPLDPGEIDLRLLFVAHDQIGARKARGAQEALDRGLGGIRAGALALLDQGWRPLGHIPEHEREPARGREGGRLPIGQAARDKPVGDEPAQILARARLHPRRDLFGEELDQEFGHLSSPASRSADARRRRARRANRR